MAKLSLLLKLPKACIFLFIFSLLAYSCTDEPLTDSELLEFAIQESNLGIEGLSKDMIIDQPLKLGPINGLESSEIFNVEIKFNNETLFLADFNAEIDYLFNPEKYNVGEGLFSILITYKKGDVDNLKIPVSIHRRLITINIPENTLTTSVVFPIVFISRKDGSLLLWKEFSIQDRQIILSSAEEFDKTTEFMLTFYLQDTGNMSGISTYQNLTRDNPKILNFSEPVRGVQQSRLDAKVPLFNFLSNDVLLGDSGGPLQLLTSLKDVQTGYHLVINRSTDYLEIGRYLASLNDAPFDTVYMYLGRSYEYLTLNFPLASDYVLDKANFSSDNLESRELIVSSNNISSITDSHLSIYGAFSQEDALSNRFHRIYHFNRYASLDVPKQYYLNNTFQSYLHALSFANYYTERKGPPLSNYQIPDVTLDYTFSNNRINLKVAGTEHVVGKVKCLDFDNLTYNWNITFKSKDTDQIIIPELPDSISHPSKNAHENGNIKVEKVELISYQSIPTYDDYLNKVFKNRKNVSDVSDWYQMIFDSRDGVFNRPIEDIIFY